LFIIELGKVKLSIVSPVYKAESLIPELVRRIEISLFHLTDDYEIILVDDRSPDKSWIAIQGLCETNQKLKGIRLSKNFGQHYAISAGIELSVGEWVVIMDCDLQDQPEEIPRLYNKAKEGFEIVQASRAARKDTFFKKLFSKLFYKVLSYLTGNEHDPAIANFGIYHRKVIDQISRLPENIRYFPTMVQWVGYNSVKLPVEHASRLDGNSSYNMKKLFNLALDIILAYSDKPIRLSIKLGLIVALSSFLFAVHTLIKYFNGEILVSGYSSLMISIWFLSGCILTTLGIVGLYVGKTFEKAKDRPYYIIDEQT